MTKNFAIPRYVVRSELLDLTSKPMILVPLLIPKFARNPGIKVWRTAESGH